MGENKSTDFVPENANEEYAVLIGRLKAFEAYANSQQGTLLEKQIALQCLGLMKSQKQKRIKLPWKVLTHQPGRYLTKNELVKYRNIITQPPVFDKQKYNRRTFYAKKW